MTKQAKILEDKISTFMTRKQMQYPELLRYIDHANRLMRIKR